VIERMSAGPSCDFINIECYLSFCASHIFRP
jgi:hypothetical protein